MKASALALAILLAAPGCSAKADAPAQPDEPARVAGIPERPDGPVLDMANILPAKDERELQNRLTRLWDETGNALVVVSVPSLGGQDIAVYARALGNRWGVGDARTHRGLLLLVAPNERRVRIEVACGLESIVTDAIAQAIIDERILPEYREGDLAGGTLAGADALHQRLALPAPVNDRDPDRCDDLKEAA